MKCPSCGTENGNNAVLCSSCGAALPVGSAQQAVPQQTAPQQAVPQQPAYQAPMQPPVPQKKSRKKGCGIAAGIVAGIIVIAIILGAVFGGNDNSSTDDGGNSAGTAQQEDSKKQQGSGTIGDFAIEIKDAKLTKDYLGDDAIQITYSFTNNSDEAESFGVALSAKAYQDGVELQSAIPSSSSDISTWDQYNDVKPGVTTDVIILYSLSNTTSNVEVEVIDWIGLHDETVVKTFALQ